MVTICSTGTSTSVVCHVFAYRYMEHMAAIQDVLQHHNQEPLLAQDIFNFAIAPDFTTARVKQLVEELGYDVKEVEELNSYIFRVEMTDGSEYHVFDESDKDEAINYKLESIEDMMPDIIKNFIDNRLGNMPSFLNPLERLERCFNIFSESMNDLDEHYHEVDLHKDIVYDRWYYICRDF